MNSFRTLLKVSWVFTVRNLAQRVSMATTAAEPVSVKMMAIVIPEPETVSVVPDTKASDVKRNVR